MTIEFLRQPTASRLSLSQQFRIPPRTIHTLSPVVPSHFVSHRLHDSAEGVLDLESEVHGLNPGSITVISKNKSLDISGLLLIICKMKWLDYTPSKIPFGSKSIILLHFFFSINSPLFSSLSSHQLIQCLLLCKGFECLGAFSDDCHVPWDWFFCDNKWGHLLSPFLPSP